MTDQSPAWPQSAAATGETVTFTEDEARQLFAQSDVTVSCPECDFQIGPVRHVVDQARTAAQHMIDVHGYTAESAKDVGLRLLIEDVRRCPRCHTDGALSAEQALNALSRTDSRTWVCEACGTAEAWEQAAGRLTPISAWPVRPTDWLKGLAGYRDSWSDVRSNRSHHPMPPPIPRELPDLRLHLIEKWIPGGLFEHLVSDGRLSISQQPYSPGSWAAAERLTLKRAGLWWVKDDMVKLITAAAPTIPDDLLASEIDLPADQAYGLAVLAEPWTGMDAANADNNVQVDAVTWCTGTVEGEPSISIGFYRYLDFTAGLSAKDLDLASWSGAILDGRIEKVGHHKVEALLGGPAGSTLLGDHDGNPALRLTGGSWMYVGRTDWPLIDNVVSFRGLPWATVEGRRESSMIEDRRWFAALCALVNHKLSAQETIHAPRQARRRAERAGVEDKEPSTVRLIRLREARHEHPDGDEPGEHKTVEWTHRWMVGSHWAWRRCGPKGGQRRMVFIAPYIKGSPDLPLVLKEDVRVWVR